MNEDDLTPSMPAAGLFWAACGVAAALPGIAEMLLVGTVNPSLPLPDALRLAAQGALPLLGYVALAGALFGAFGALGAHLRRAWARPVLALAAVLLLGPSPFTTIGALFVFIGALTAEAGSRTRAA